MNRLLSFFLSRISERHKPYIPLTVNRWLVVFGLAFCPALRAADQTTFSPAPVFTVSPLASDKILAVIPLGNLNPHGGHVFPTDHIYLDYGGEPGLPVAAPAAGTVFAIRGQLRNDAKIEIRVDEHLGYYLGHLFLGPGIEVGSPLKAGQIVGRVSARSLMDVGAYDDRASLPGFINRGRYPSSTLHTVSPLRLFMEPARSQLYAKVAREGPDKNGRIDFDQPGRLVGNWFHSSLSVDDSMCGQPEIWAKHLAFVYDVRQPGAVRISVGGTVMAPGIYAIQSGAPDPATVNMNSGLVKYQLRLADHGAGGPATLRSQSAIGWLHVQLIGEAKMKVEFFPGITVDMPEDFTRNANIYER